MNIIKLFNISDLFYQSLSDPFIKNAYKNHFDLGAGATFYYTTDPSPNPKKSYFYLRWINNLSGNFLSLFNSHFPMDSTGHRTIWNTQYAQYLRSDFMIFLTWKIMKNQVSDTLNMGVVCLLKLISNSLRETFFMQVVLKS